MEAGGEMSERWGGGVDVYYESGASPSAAATQTKDATSLTPG
jgi:hypothetical protein